MGIVNVTPDSFSDGGSHLTVGRAVARALTMTAAGARIIDGGGESTRPGADRVDACTEQHRVLPVIRELTRSGVVVSVDTMRAETASAALEAGASWVNDVSGGLADRDMARVVADAGVPFVVMHWRAHSLGMRNHAVYDDVVADVRRELAERVEALVDAGIDPRQVVLDPGLGFAKRPQHDWDLLAGLEQIVSLGFPVLVGASRKSFLGELTRSPDGVVPPGQRDILTAAVTTLVVSSGATWVRVHDVAANHDGLLVGRAWARAKKDSPLSTSSQERPGHP
jgi:dihydropteroate synthase